jgi:hypothetical protein
MITRDKWRSIRDNKQVLRKGVAAEVELFLQGGGRVNCFEKDGSVIVKTMQNGELQQARKFPTKEAYENQL